MEKLELEAYGLSEINQTEILEIDAGFWNIVAGGLAIAVGAEIIGDWDDFKEGLTASF